MTLYDQGDAGNGVYCIQGGLVGLRRVDADGNSVLLRLCPAGTTVGYRAFLSKEPHVNSAEVLTPSVVCFIDRSLVAALLSKNPQLGERFLEHSIADLSATESDHVRILTKSLKSRFLHIMMVFYEQVGYQDQAGCPSLDIPVKRADLAEIIGAQPESISRLIRKLQVEGLLQFEGRHVRITDMDALLREAGAEL